MACVVKAEVLNLLGDRRYLRMTENLMQRAASG